MQSVQNQVASSWAKLLRNRTNKLQIRIPEIPRCGKNNNLQQFQCQQVGPGPVDGEQPYLTSKGLTGYTSNGSFHVDKCSGAFRRSLLRPNPSIVQVSCRTFKTIRDKLDEETRNPSLVADKNTSKSRSLTATEIIIDIISKKVFFGIFDGESEVRSEDVHVTFGDVIGVDEAKSELQDIAEFLRNHGKFIELGGKLPKGVLLVGPPGTGKTSLARAVAGEAGVPFFYAAGSDFDQMLDVQGAVRLQNLFDAAKAKSPCVIFIDEIDLIGAKRTNTGQKSHTNQTINQLLSEMDGFRQNEGVIVIGATNGKEYLDTALLRPGRFDVHVQVPAPGLSGRKNILEYYLAKVKRGDDVDVEALARRSLGFTGADLENMVNQAALRAAIEDAESVGEKHLEFAYKKLIIRAQKNAAIPGDQTLVAAYQEGGRALIALLTENATPLHKVTIIPKSSSMRGTSNLPTKEQYYMNKQQLLAQMDIIMGGMAAEELAFEFSAFDDLEKVESIATHIVEKWGVSEKDGLSTMKDDGNVTAELIDEEITRLLLDSFDRVNVLLLKHAKVLVTFADALIKYETLDTEDAKDLHSQQGLSTDSFSDYWSGIAKESRGQRKSSSGSGGS